MANSESQDQRLNAFNALFAEIYGERTKFRKFLTKPQNSDEQIDQWYDDKKWVSNYLNKFLRNLTEELQTNFPDLDATIVTLLYGLGEDGQFYSAVQIAERLNLSVQSVKETKKKFIDFLKSQDGRESIERIAIEATHEYKITSQELTFLLKIYKYFAQNHTYPDNQWIKQEMNLKDNGLGNIKKNLRDKNYLDPKFQNAVLTPTARKLLRSLSYTPPLEILVLGDVKAGRSEFEEIVTIQDVDNLTALELDTISIPNTIGTDKQVFALRVVGNSMERENIFDGDFVVIQKCLPFEKFKDGELIAAKYLPKEKEYMIDLDNENSADNLPDEDLNGPTLKRIYYGNRNLRIKHILTPLKEDRDSENVIETWHVVPKGKVISVFRKVTN